MINQTNTEFLYELQEIKRNQIRFKTMYDVNEKYNLVIR